MEVVIGIDLGTSAVKTIMMDKTGEIVAQASNGYPLIEEKDGFVEQDPTQWVAQTKRGLKELMQQQPDVVVSGISFSGQMHGLVLVDEQGNLLRNAILWNDTRTTEQCREIERVLGKSLYDITKNDALEGFTLPKLLWVKQFEQDVFQRIHKMMLPKDYVRFCMTGEIAMEPTDAAGTLLFDVAKNEWSKAICEAFAIPFSLCPPLIATDGFSNNLTDEYAKIFNGQQVPVFAGGADNACGALGAGIVTEKQALVSIGTSGVVLSPSHEATYVGNFVHTFSNVKPNSIYNMGVTLAAGESLRWYRSTFAKDLDFTELLEDLNVVGAGANGLLFAPYLFGERTPVGDASVRASFIGMKNTHERAHFTRAVIEGITYSLKQSYELIAQKNSAIDQITCIGGAAKNPVWLQIIADVFNKRVAKLTDEQGPALGAALLAAVGAKWFASYEEAVQTCVEVAEVYTPNEDNVKVYEAYYKCYVKVYEQTKLLSAELLKISQA